MNKRSNKQKLERSRDRRQRKFMFQRATKRGKT